MANSVRWLTIYNTLEATKSYHRIHYIFFNFLKASIIENAKETLNTLKNTFNKKLTLTTSELNPRVLGMQIQLYWTTIIRRKGPILIQFHQNRAWKNQGGTLPKRNPLLKNKNMLYVACKVREGFIYLSLDIIKKEIKKRKFNINSYIVLREKILKEDLIREWGFVLKNIPLRMGFNFKKRKLFTAGWLTF